MFPSSLSKTILAVASVVMVDVSKLVSIQHLQSATWKSHPASDLITRINPSTLQ